MLDDVVYCEEMKDTILSYVKLHRAGHQIKLDGDEGIFIHATRKFAIPISMNKNILTLLGKERNQHEMMKQKFSQDSNEIEETNVTTRSVSACNDSKQIEKQKKKSTKICTFNQSLYSSHSHIFYFHPIIFFTRSCSLWTFMWKKIRPINCSQWS